MLNTSGQSLIQFLASVAQICKIQEVTDQRKLPILWRLNWNHSCLRKTISKNWTYLPYCWNHSLTRSWYKLKWLQKIAKHMKKTLGLPSSQESPLAVILLLNVLVPSSTTKSFLTRVLEWGSVSHRIFDSARNDVEELTHAVAESVWSFLKRSWAKVQQSQVTESVCRRAQHKGNYSQLGRYWTKGTAQECTCAPAQVLD